MYYHGITILQLVLIFVSLVDAPDAQSDQSNIVKWNTRDGDKLPRIDINYEGENFFIHLREAPFCRLWETDKCQCFMLRDDDNFSNSGMASFAYCDGDIRGHYLNRTDYFEIDTFWNAASREFNVTKYPPPANYIVKRIDTILERNNTKYFDQSYHYFKPLSLSRLKEYETGFIPLMFVIDKDVFQTQPRERIKFYLQNLINDANYFLEPFNIVAVYKGWKLARTFLDTEEKVDSFIEEDHKAYVGKGKRRIVVFLTPEEVEDTETTMSGKAERFSICRPTIGLFLLYNWRREKFSLRSEAITLAHELGHTMGLMHTEDTICANMSSGGTIHIMGAREHNVEADIDWTPCSRKFVQTHRSNFFCLREKIKPPKPSCRNGVLEEGEQCECVSDACRKCCDDNCQLTKNSQCSSGPCCDKKTCKFRTKDEEYICREDEDSCDIPEMCSGRSAKCPVNYVVANGYDCGGPSNESYCFNGKCGNRQHACSWLFDNGYVGDDECYKLNLIDNSPYHGCGPTFRETPAVRNFACSKEDMYCGKILCKCSTQECKFDNESDLANYWDEINGRFDRATKCYFIELGSNPRDLREDLTFVQNGSVCGDRKMCVQQKCVPLPPGCPKNCPGKPIQHPVTHQWLPAYILPDPNAEESDSPGNGGSSSSYWFQILVYFLALLLSIGLLLIGIKQQNTRTASKEPSSPQKLV